LSAIAVATGCGNGGSSASGGRLDPAARALGLSRKGLYLKRQRLGIADGPNP
jgi:DNA-binding NtrC family response regulator